MASIKDDKVVVLIGKRETGKSFLTKDLLYYHQDIPVGTVISATESVNQFYGKIVPSLFIHDEYNENIILNVLKRQKQVVDKMNQDVDTYGKSNVDPRGFLILDDCLYDQSWTKSKYIRSLFMNGRHYKIMFIITMQYALGVPPNLRTNIDYVFVLRENIFQNRKRLYEGYAGMFPTFEIFCQVMDQCTENFECLVINNNAKSNKLEDQVFWYKAMSHPDFQMGARVFWEHHSNNFNDSYNGDNNGDEFDINNLRKKKNTTLINVKKI
tara:strand:+ start:258 stop:1061 length:804 start_codon:yes stop_codon:yes gene_type:complete